MLTHLILLHLITPIFHPISCFSWLCGHT
jgi:hypothetical protein